MPTFQRCQTFKAKPKVEQKRQIDKCRKDGGSWSPSYCVCKKKSRVGIK